MDAPAERLIEGDHVKRLRRRLAEDGGLTLIELMVAMAVSLVVVGSLLAALGAATRAESTSATQRDKLQELRDAVSRATTDIREATDVSGASTSSKLDIHTLVAGTPKRMIFEVAGSSFVRTVCSDAGFGFSSSCGGTPTELARDVGADAFCYDPPACVASSPSQSMRLVRITIAGTPSHPSDDGTALGTDIQLRNR